MFHRLNLRVFSILMILGLFFSPSLITAQSAQTPKEVVQEIYTLLKRYDDKSPTNKKDKETINNHFLLQDMAYDAIKDHWTKLTSSQKKEYNSLMNQLLLKTVYEDTGDKISKGNFNIKQERTISATRSIVMTEIVLKKNNLKVSNNYILTKQKDGSYKVREILIDNANLAMDYKSQFNQIIDEYGIDENKNSLFPRIRSAISKKDKWSEISDSKPEKTQKRKRRPTLLEQQ